MALTPPLSTPTRRARALRPIATLLRAHAPVRATSTWAYFGRFARTHVGSAHRRPSPAAVRQAAERIARDCNDGQELGGA